MSIGSASSTVAPGADQVLPEPTLKDVQRRERWLIAGLGAIVAIIFLVGWLSISSEQSLLQQASESTSNAARMKALNILAHRGYWEKRPPVELRVFVSTQPEEVRQFMHRMHHPLMSR